MIIAKDGHPGHVPARAEFCLPSRGELTPRAYDLQLEYYCSLRISNKTCKNTEIFVNMNVFMRSRSTLLFSRCSPCMLKSGNHCNTWKCLAYNLRHAGSRRNDINCKLLAHCTIAKQESPIDLSSFGSSPLVPPEPPLAIVISGPSGVGKDAVIRELQRKRPDLHFVVTATSRSMRPGEKNGVDYLFVSKETFEQWIECGALLEHAIVYGEYKGIPRRQVEDALENNTDVVLRVDVQGAATMRKLLPNIVSIFLIADTEVELVQRLVDRKTEPEDKMKIRIETAREEINHIVDFDYVVVNKDGKMKETVDIIEKIILSEKHKVSKRVLSVK